MNLFLTILSLCSFRCPILPLVRLLMACLLLSWHDPLHLVHVRFHLAAFFFRAWYCFYRWWIPSYRSKESMEASWRLTFSSPLWCVGAWLRKSSGEKSCGLFFLRKCRKVKPASALRDGDRYVSDVYGYLQLKFLQSLQLSLLSGAS